jgi:class 3 adenylate cyclase/predicted ATPase
MGRPLDRRTLAFLFTDIEGSTRRWEAFPEAMVAALEQHDDLLRRVVTEHRGTAFHFSGDGMVASFEEPTDALAAAIAAQREIGGGDWSAVGGIGVRMCVHVGDVVLRDGEPFGWALNFGSRLNSIGHGGQTLLSEAAVEALDEALRSATTCASLGRHRLRDIVQPAEVFQLSAPGLEHDFPPLRGTVQPAALVELPDRLVGRENDVADVAGLLGDHRLVTIVGPPGIGGSRVAAAAANRMAAQHAHGVQHADLSDVSPQRMTDAIATALGVGRRRGASVEESLVEWLGEHDVLLVLDHVGRGVETIARLLRSALAQAPRLRVLCTSQRPLDVDGERIRRLDPLQLDDAVALFTQCAASSGGNAEDTPTLRAVCERLDRMPLSIEIVAGSTAAYSVEELAEMLARREFPEPVNGDMSMRSLTNAVAVAVDGLEPDRRVMLEAATAFSGPFGRTAFSRVCAPDIERAQAHAALNDLITRSLIHVERGTGTDQFRLLHHVADAVRDRADTGTLEGAEQRFTTLMIALVEEASAGLRGPDEQLWDSRLSRHFGNIGAAVGRCIASGDVTSATSIVVPMWEYGFMRMNDECFRWAERLIATFTGRVQEALVAPAVGVAALGAWIRDDLDDAYEWSRRALRLERELGLEFDLPARLALINATVYSGDGAAPPEIFAEQAEYQRARPELYFHVNVNTQMSMMSTWLGDKESAERRALRAVTLARQSRNPSSIAYALWALGTAIEEDDPLRAESLLGTALETAREVNNGWVTVLVQMSLASLRRRISSPIDAVPLLLDQLDILWRTGHRSHLWATVRLCSLVAGDLHNDELAFGLEAAVEQAGLVMPALPVDATALQTQHERICETHPPGWAERTAAIAATWDVDTIVGLIRDDFNRAVAAATG